MVDFGGFNVETPQEVLARLDAQDQQLQAAAASGSPQARAEANLQRALGGFTRVEQVRTAQRAQQAVVRAAEEFQANPDADPMVNEIDRLQAQFEAVSAIDPKAAESIKARQLAVQQQLFENNRLTAQDDRALRELEDRLQSTALDRDIAQASADRARRREQTGTTDDVLVFRNANGDIIQAANNSELGNSLLEQGVEFLGTQSQLNLLNSQTAIESLRQKHKDAAPQKPFTGAEQSTIAAARQGLSLMNRAREIVEGDEITGGTGIVQNLGGLRAFVARAVDLPIEDAEFVELVNLHGQMRIIWQDLLAGNPSNAENALAENITFGPGRSKEFNLQIMDTQQQILGAKVKQLYAEALLTDKPAQVVRDLLVSLGEDPDDPAILGFTQDQVDALATTELAKVREARAAEGLDPVGEDNDAARRQRDTSVIRQRSEGDQPTEFVTQGGVRIR